MNNSPPTPSITKNMAAPIDIQTDALLGQTREMLYGQAENIEPYIAQHQQAATQAPQYRPQNVQTLETSHVQCYQYGGQPSVEQCKHSVCTSTGQGNSSVNSINYTTNQPAYDTKEPPLWITNILKSLDARLQNIELQLTQQNSRWQKIDNQLQQQNARIANVEQSVKQIPDLKKNIAHAEVQVHDMSKQVEHVHSLINDYSDSMDHFSQTFDDILTKESSNKSTVDEICERLARIEAEQSDFKTKQDSAESKIIDLQCRSMRENLLFTGIEESIINNENTEELLQEFLSDKMQITDEIPFDRVHRVGKYKPDQIYPRAIVAKFEHFKDREKVRFSAPKTLKGSPYGVREQFPFEVESKRRLLYPEMKRARENKDNKVRLVRDKLYINDSEFKPRYESNQANSVNIATTSSQNKLQPRYQSDKRRQGNNQDWHTPQPQRT